LFDLFAQRFGLGVIGIPTQTLAGANDQRQRGSRECATAERPAVELAVNEESDVVRASFVRSAESGLVQHEAAWILTRI